MANLRTPQHVIETRTEHIAEQKRALTRLTVVQNEWLRPKIEAEIRVCEGEISYAKHRLSLGLTEPYQA
jgi:hypothetical protein